MDMPTDLRKAISDAVTCRARGDNAASNAAVDVIFTYNNPGVLAACASWADLFNAISIGRAVLDHADECVMHECLDGAAPVMVGFEVGSRVDGTIVDPDTLPPEMHGHVWALRFVAAVGNRDEDQAIALFKQLCDGPDSLDTGPAALLQLAAQAYGSER